MLVEGLSHLRYCHNVVVTGTSQVGSEGAATNLFRCLFSLLRRPVLKRHKEEAPTCKGYIHTTHLTGRLTKAFLAEV